MAVNGKTLSGSRGVILRGPEEHAGESEHSWKGTSLGGDRKTMFLRVQKVRGIRPDADPHSPIIQLDFRKGGLHIFLEDVAGGPGGLSLGPLNPYTNAVSERAPFFVVKSGDLAANTTYDLDCETGPFGDFLILTGTPKAKRSKSKVRRLIVINLWAVFSLQGLESVDSRGVALFGGKIIGHVHRNVDDRWPFIRNHEFTADTFDEAKRWVESFKQTSARLAMGFAQRKDDPLIAFDVIARSVYSDRATASQEDGIARAIEAFQNLFPREESKLSRL